MTEGPKRPYQFHLWQVIFWLTFVSIYIGVAAASYRNRPIPSTVLLSLVIGAMLMFYRWKRRRDRARESQTSD